VRRRSVLCIAAGMGEASDGMQNMEEAAEGEGEGSSGSVHMEKEEWAVSS
jgi:hypothetical protein